MPTSNYGHLLPVLGLASDINPQSILEVGLGFGKYGFLLREILDLNPDEEKGYKDWQKRFDGIEIFEKYITPAHRYLYNNIYIGDAVDILDDLDCTYDMLLSVDVLEHFTKKRGIEFIEKSRRRAKTVVLATPYGYYHQEECWNNPHEAHYSAWTHSDFKALGAKYVWTVGIAIIAVFTDDTFDSLPNHPNDVFTPRHLQDLFHGTLRYLQTEQYQECIDLGHVLLTYYPKEQTILSAIAISYEKLDNDEKASEYIEISLAINPNLNDALILKEKIRNKM